LHNRDGFAQKAQNPAQKHVKRGVSHDSLPQYGTQVSQKHREMRSR